MILLVDGSCHEYFVTSFISGIATYSYEKKEKPYPQLIKINNKNKFEFLCDAAKIQLRTFLLVIKRNKIKISKFLVRDITELSLI